MALFDTSSHLDFSCREMRQIFICHNRLFINGLWLNPVFCTDATQRPLIRSRRRGSFVHRLGDVGVMRVASKDNSGVSIRGF
jgi:hypothetical protein